MNYAGLTVESPSWIKRWSHRSRFVRALELGALDPGHAVADYGAGDGYLLQAVLSRGMRGELWAFEPMLAEQARARLLNRVRIVERADELPTAHFDRVFCMEVIEHLPEPVRAEALNNIRQLLKPGGKAVITVPVEIGLSSVFKNAVRIAMGKPHAGTGAGALFWSAIGAPARIRRVETGRNYISSHLGFDYRALPNELCSHGFAIERRSFSPAPLLGPILNSQVSYVVRRADTRQPEL
jgi:SAM-dependent methyltransferase